MLDLSIYLSNRCEFYHGNFNQLRLPLAFILGSIVVSIPACHAGDRGSIPRRGGYVIVIIFIIDDEIKMFYVQFYEARFAETSPL